MVLLCLDIDGVLNAPGQADVWGDTLQTGSVAVDLNWRDPDSPTIDVNVTWSPRAIAAIRELVTQPHVTASFLSAWGVWASSTFAPLVGLPNHMGYAAAPALSEPGYTGTGLWKSVWLLDNIYVGAPPIAVIDDQLTGGEASELRRRAKQCDVPLCIVAPDGHAGVTPRELGLLRAWIARHGGREEQ